MITKEQGDRIIALLEAILEEVETERTKNIRWYRMEADRKNAEQLKESEEK